MHITCSRGSLTCELIRFEPKNPDVLREPSLALHGNLEGWGTERGGRPGGRGCMNNSGWFTWLYGRNQHNVVKQFSSN